LLRERCIGLSVADRVRDLHLTLSDISEDALQVACINTTKLDLSDRSELIVSDLFEHIPDIQFDIIASNPPYITAEEMHALSEDILCYEPHGALEGGSDGLEYYRRIIMQAQKFLKAPGHLLLEIGSKQLRTSSIYLHRKDFGEFGFGGLCRTGSGCLPVSDVRNRPDPASGIISEISHAT
jgi:release factor glutamine methyltransferase